MFEIPKNTLYNMAEELYLCQKNDSNNPEIFFCFSCYKNKRSKRINPEIALTTIYWFQLSSINNSFTLLLDATRSTKIFGIFRDFPKIFGIPKFGNPEISGLRFSGFRESRKFGIEIFGIRDSRTSGFPGIPELRDPEAPP